MQSLDNPFASPPGSYPPATTKWNFTSTTVPAGFGQYVVSPQPGTPLGTFIPITWQITSVFFRVETPSASANTTLQIARCIGTEDFSVTNYINTTPIVILPNTNEVLTFSAGILNNNLVRTGDKLQPVIAFGAGAAIVTMCVTLAEMPGV